MDLVFDLDVSVPAAEVLPIAPVQPAAVVTALCRWYDAGYDEARGSVTIDVMTFYAASTQELLAYWWGAHDATVGRPRRYLA